MLVMSMQKYRISPIEQSVMMVKFPSKWKISQSKTPPPPFPPPPPPPPPPPQNVYLMNYKQNG